MEASTNSFETQRNSSQAAFEARVSGLFLLVPTALGLIYTTSLHQVVLVNTSATKLRACTHEKLVEVYGLSYSDSDIEDLVAEAANEYSVSEGDARQEVERVLREVEENFPYYECASCGEFVGINPPKRCPSCSRTKFQKSYRESQQEIIVHTALAFRLGDIDNVIIEAPTGIGKSVINYVLGLMMGRAFYTTPQKSLRNQLDADDALDDGMHALRSRRDYTCGFSGKDCDKCPVSRGTSDTGFSCWQVDACTYWNNKDRSFASPIAAVTFAYLIVDNFLPVQMTVTKGEGDSVTEQVVQISFDDRDVVIVDEAHKLENQVASLHAGFELTPGGLGERIYDDTDTRLRGLEQRMQVDRYGQVEDVVEDIADRAKIFAERNKDVEDEDTQDQVKKCESFLRKYEWLTKSYEKGRDWVADIIDVQHPRTRQSVKGLQLKPVRVDTFLEEFVWSRGGKRIISTATAKYRGKPSKWVNRLGLPGKTKVITCDMPFPKENRPVHLGTIIDKFSSGGDKDNWDEIVSEVKRLAAEHSGQKGLIHTSSYDRAERLVNDLPGGMAMMDIRSVDSDAMVEIWQDDDAQILCSPSMTEGVDLEGDMCRWQVLLKVPYADSRNDSRVSYMLDELNDWNWYYESAGLECFQSIGRAVRSKDDWADYYVLDASFRDVLKKTTPPEWVTEAIDDKSHPTANSMADALTAEW